MSRPYFEPVNSHVSFPRIEEEVLAFWNNHGIFQESLKATVGKEEFVFFDGPPFATGLPHYGHLLAGTLKDIVPRYWTMRGRHVGRRFGWDCHGLPVENEMEKEFKVSGKKDIEKLGIHLFNEACRSIVLRYTGQWEEIVRRMGRWVDFESQYRTMDPAYMESIWWVFGQVWKKDLIYQGFRVQPYCPRCSTPLSNFEVTEGYKDIQSPSITISFPLSKENPTDPTRNLLVWTTTPWTLPSNVALAVGSNIRYVEFKYNHSDKESFIIAYNRYDAHLKEFLKEHQSKGRLKELTKDSSIVVKEFLGETLKGQAYEPMFDYFKGVSPKFFHITTADFVSTEDGTGIVHIAPAFGEDDFEVGRKLDLPIVCPVDDEGKFTDAMPENFAGHTVYDVDSAIIHLMKKKGRVFIDSTMQHRYPHCYRCETKLIYKAITTWFMRIGPLKANMLDNNKRIGWVPSHLQAGRFGKGIEAAPDWNISRNRYWGTPIPVWLCGCGHRECVGSLAELHRLAGNGDEERGRSVHEEKVKEVQQDIRGSARTRFEKFNIDESWAQKLEHTVIGETDIHRHIVDLLAMQCPRCGAPMTRTPEVLDCWFESGSMPYAQLHYPFENSRGFGERFPADFIAEGLDQTRGWFYTLTVLASALFGKEAFRNVIVNGIILSEDGKKLSKRLRNYEPPGEVLNKLGADALRLFLINSPAVKAEDLRFSEHGVQEMSRSVLLPFWNAYAFFVTYANVDGWVPEGGKPPGSSNELDRWIVSLLNELVDAVNAEMARYNLYRVVPLLVDFIDNLTNWYIRRSRRRFWKSENDGDKENAYATLHHVLVEFSKVMAPFLPFLTEAIYRNLRGCKDAGPKAEGTAPVSVHLAPFPDAEQSLIDDALVQKMRLVRGIVGMGRALRSRFSIKTRQPLSELTVVIRDENKRALLQGMEPLIREELNVKAIRFDSDEDSVVGLSAKPNYKLLGRLFGPKMKEAAGHIEAFSPARIKALEAGGSIDVLGVPVGLEGIEIRRTRHQGVEVETQDGVTVALNTEITRELEQECAAREFVNRVQTIRKNRDFNVSDRIGIRCSCPPDLQEALQHFAEYIRNETLAVALDWNIAGDAGAAETVEINGIRAEVQVTLAG